MDIEDEEFYLAQAARCRRLAGVLPNQLDPAVKLMLSMAEDYEAQAAAYRNSLKTLGL